MTQQTVSSRTNRGTPTFKSPSVGIARDFGKRTLELESEGIQVSLNEQQIAKKWTSLTPFGNG